MLYYLNYSIILIWKQLFNGISFFSIVSKLYMCLMYYIHYAFWFICRHVGRFVFLVLTFFQFNKESMNYVLCKIKKEQETKYFEGNLKHLSKTKNLKIVIVSDTHGQHKKFEYPPGDILIHAGDLTRTGTLLELKRLDKFFGTLPYKYIIVIAGNHDFFLDKKVEKCRKILKNCIYLMDSSVVIEGLKIYGTPWLPWYCSWGFTICKGRRVKNKWDMIPDDTDILITHTPPHGTLDKNMFMANRGCRHLKDRVKSIKPKLHIFGHVHENHGVEQHSSTTYVNASLTNFMFLPKAAPITVNYDMISHKVTAYNHHIPQYISSETQELEFVQ